MVKNAHTAIICLTGGLSAVWGAGASAQEQTLPPYKPTSSEIRAQYGQTADSRLSIVEERVVALGQQVEAIESYLAEVYNVAAKSSGQSASPPAGTTSALTEPPVKTMPVTGGQYHFVQAGETLPSIAQKYGLPADELAAVNRMERVVDVAPGYRLWIPAARAPKQQPPAPPSGGAVSGNAEWSASYHVQPGDTLYSIARRAGVTANEIARQNRLNNADQIAVGQQLRLPAGQIPGRASAPQPQTQTSAPPAAVAPSVEETYHYYYVVPGDTLSSLARIFFTSESTLLRLNKLPDTKLQVGQRLIVPSRLYLENELRLQQQQQQQQQSAIP